MEELTEKWKSLVLAMEEKVESANWHCYHYERQINNNNNKHDMSKHDNYDSTPTVKDRSRIQRRAREEEPEKKRQRRRARSKSKSSEPEKQAGSKRCDLLSGTIWMNKRQRREYSTTIIVNTMPSPILRCLQLQLRSVQRGRESRT
jgi:hypothetical protein